MLKLLISSLLASSAIAAPLAIRDSGLPFTQLVAFGDNLSDNGNGSYAHCVQAGNGTDCSNKIYGFGTWTDGPVAVSYLADNLAIPLTYDYAYGHADGGSKFGATIDNSYTQSTANAPSSKDQIANYTSTNPTLKQKIGETLHFLWVGNNDINLYHFYTSETNNTAFAKSMSTMLAAQVQTLLDAGASYVFVPGLYAKNISPSKKFYASNQQQYDNMGSIIQEANSEIKTALSALNTNNKQVIYHDVFQFMTDLWNSGSSKGITHEGDEFCDGFSQQDWDLCVTQKQGASFYWMQYLDMTTHVHQLIAADMAKVIKAAVSGSSSGSAPATTSSQQQQASATTKPLQKGQDADVSSTITYPTPSIPATAAGYPSSLFTSTVSLPPQGQISIPTFGATGNVLSSFYATATTTTSALAAATSAPGSGDDAVTSIVFETTVSVKPVATSIVSVNGDVAVADVIEVDEVLVEYTVSEES